MIAPSSILTWPSSSIPKVPRPSRAAATPGVTRETTTSPSRTTMLPFGSNRILRAITSAAAMPSRARPNTTRQSPTTARQSASTRTPTRRFTAVAIPMAASTRMTLQSPISRKPSASIRNIRAPSPRAARRGNGRVTTHAHSRTSTKSIRMEPSSADRYIERSAMLNNNGQYDRAIADIAKAISLDPKNARAYSTRAYVREKHGLRRLRHRPPQRSHSSAIPTRAGSICRTG